MCKFFTKQDLLLQDLSFCLAHRLLAQAHAYRCPLLYRKLINSEQGVLFVIGIVRFRWALSRSFPYCDEVRAGLWVGFDIKPGRLELYCELPRRDEGFIRICFFAGLAYLFGDSPLLFVSNPCLYLLPRLRLNLL